MTQSMGSGGRILVAGADGQLGAAIVRRMTAMGQNVVATTRRGGSGSLPLDISANPSEWKLPEEISAAFLCAAITNVTVCREQPLAARVVNVQGTAALAERLAAAGAFVVFPSSNRVFDGTVAYQRSDAATCPMTEYGVLKAEAERAILALGGQASVVRFTKIIGPQTGPFSGWTAALQAGIAVHPFADMVMSPISLDYSVESLVRIAVSQASGIFQVSGANDVTYEHACRVLADQLGARPDLVQPVHWKESKGVFEHVPAHTTLDTTLLRDRCSLIAPDIRQTLVEVLSS
jgi:dTDP-4-dehydrorhamnose reductase